MLDELLDAISPHIAALYRCSEVLAMLDMLVAFAHVASTSSSYVRPEFTDTLAIKDGRHPVLGRFCYSVIKFAVLPAPNIAERYKFTDGAFVPNDTYATDAATFQILTGVGRLFEWPEHSHLHGSALSRICRARQPSSSRLQC